MITLFLIIPVCVSIGFLAGAWWRSLFEGQSDGLDGVDNWNR